MTISLILLFDGIFFFISWTTRKCTQCEVMICERYNKANKLQQLPPFGLSSSPSPPRSALSKMTCYWSTAQIHESKFTKFELGFTSPRTNPIIAAVPLKRIFGFFLTKKEIVLLRLLSLLLFPHKQLKVTDSLRMLNVILGIVSIMNLK